MFKTASISAITAIVLCLGTADANAACDTAESHQFDFWVGAWNVYPNTKGAKQVATSLIEKLYGGCGIRENWMPSGGTGGGSLNVYSQASGHWEQFWVDSTGSAVHFIGGLEGKAMVIQGNWPRPGHPDAISRITYTPRNSGRVEQFGEISYDNGQNWQVDFDLIYRPTK